MSEWYIHQSPTHADVGDVVSVASRSTTRGDFRSTATARVGVVETIVARRILHTSDSVGVRAAPRIVAPVLVSESLGVSATSHAGALVQVSDAWGVSISSTGVAHLQQLATERLAVRSRSSVEASASASDALGARGTAPSIVVAVQAREVVGARATALVYREFLATATEAFYARARSFAGLYGGAVEVLGARGTSPAALQRDHQMVTESVGVRAHTTGLVLPSGIFRDAIGIRITSSATARIVAHRTERAFVYARSWVPFAATLPSFHAPASLADTSAWTADARSWGMSRYAGLPVSEWAEVSGVTFGAGPGGVYVREGDAPVSWIETSKLQFADQFASRIERKRISHLYTYAQHVAPLSVAVSGDYQGAFTTVYYTQPVGAGDSTRAVRTPVGRGFASNFYMFKIGGPAFDLYKFEVELATTQRRV